MVTIVVWIVGILAIRHFLDLSGGVYPMLDKFTRNPRYNAKAHDYSLTLIAGWTVVCIALGSLWHKASGKGGGDSG